MKTCITPPELDIFNLMTSDNLHLTRTNQMLVMVLSSIPGTIHVGSSALFQFNMAALAGEASNCGQKLAFVPTDDEISDVKNKICNVLQKFVHGAIKCRFRIDSRYTSWPDNSGK